MLTAHIRKALADPTVRFWVKQAIRDLLDRDPVDAYHDARLLADLFRERCDMILQDTRYSIGRHRP